MPKEKTKEESSTELANYYELNANYRELKNRIRQQDTLIIGLLERISRLENKKKEKPKKVLGITITQKTDMIRGKGYKRWYGVYKDGEKRRWIYIGCNINNAEKKIKTWFLKHKGEQI